MKRRCVPLKADHNLLTPNAHTLLGVRLCPVIQVRSEGVSSLSGHLSDSSSSKSTVGSTRQRSAASPTRRLRFEDETETEAESRYLERQWQRRQAGKRASGVLVSKPDLNLYVNSKVGLRGLGHVVDRQQGGGTAGAGQCDSSGTVSEGGVNLNFRLHPTPPVPDDPEWSLYWPRLKLRTEPIKETYIGSVTPTDPSRGGGGAQGVPNMQVRRKTNQVELNGNQALPTTELPINPYADPLITPTFKHTSVLTLATSRCTSSSTPPPVTSGMRSQNASLNSTTAGQSVNQNQEEQGIPAAVKPHRELPSGGETKERSPCVAPTTKNSYSSSETAVESQSPPTSESSSDGHVRQPMRVQLHSDVTALSEQFGSRDRLSSLSLRHLFSSVTLSRTRTSSLDRLTSRPCPTASDPAPCGPAPLDPRKSSSLLSVQGSPFLQLRKSSSVQSFVSEQKKKKDRSADYRPAAKRYLQRSLSVEDVGCPSSLRSVGRLLHVCPDGTFLLELSRPQSQTYGFMISKGSRGVYVEDMVDSSTEKLYAGLLAVGDEILEVNGEKVACLTLDQVTHLLTHNSSTTVRVLRHWRSPPR